MNSDSTLSSRHTIGRPEKYPSRFYLGLQRAIGWALLLPFCGIVYVLVRWVGGYRIENIREIRRIYRELCRPDRPLLICSNHLTILDSVLIIWALGSTGWYFFNYKRFTWNLPAGDFFRKTFAFRIVAFLAKCIYVFRNGSERHRTAVLDLCLELIKKGEVVTVFPEGKRSRSGKFELEHLTNGVGKLIHDLGDCRVLCLYVRGDRQVGFSNYPKRGSKYRLKYRVLEPKSQHQGREGYRDLTTQIGHVIKEMESEYFYELGRTPGA